MVVAAAIGMLVAVPLSTAVISHSGSSVSGPEGPGVGASSSSQPKAAPANCATGMDPEFIAYDPVNKYFYVGDDDQNHVSVYDKSCTLVTTIVLPKGAQPRGVVYDPSNNYVYVTNFTQSTQGVFVISGTVVKQKITNACFDETFAATVDPAAGYYTGGGAVVVTSLGNSMTCWIAGTPSTGTQRVYGSVGVGAQPLGIAYSSFGNALMVANAGSDTVTSIGASTGVIIDQSIPVGFGPYGILSPPDSLDTFVANYLGDNVSIITPMGVIGQITVGEEPVGLAFDQKNLHIFVTNYESDNLSVIDNSYVVSATIPMPAGCSPIGVAYNANVEKMDVSCFTSDQIYVES
jgi:YVTN family beta-propeller protein